MITNVSSETAECISRLMFASVLAIGYNSEVSGQFAFFQSSSTFKWPKKLMQQSLFTNQSK